MSFLHAVWSVFLNLTTFMFVDDAVSHESTQCILEDGSSHPCPQFDDTTEGLRLFTAEELAEYDGTKRHRKIYLACIGEVFDVSTGRAHYGPNNGGYRGFAGKDGSRAFSVGGFTEKELIADITDLSPSAIQSVYEWMLFYRKDYIALGKLVGLYYDADGRPTEKRRIIEAKLLEAYYHAKQVADMGQQYPRCNSQSGTRVRNRVWCTPNSGGVKREWTGVPRHFLDPTMNTGGTQGRTRCACVPLGEANDDTRFKQYDDAYPCAWDAHECFLEDGQEIQERNKRSDQQTKKYKEQRVKEIAAQQRKSAELKANFANRKTVETQPNEDEKTEL